MNYNYIAYCTFLLSFNVISFHFTRYALEKILPQIYISDGLKSRTTKKFNFCFLSFQAKIKSISGPEHIENIWVIFSQLLKLVYQKCI